MPLLRLIFVSMKKDLVASCMAVYTRSHTLASKSADYRYPIWWCCTDLDSVPYSSYCSVRWRCLHFLGTCYGKWTIFPNWGSSGCWRRAVQKIT